MGMTIWVNVRVGDSYESNQRDHSAILRTEAQMETLADRLAVPRLSSFYDETDLRLNMSEEVGGIEELGDDADGWPADAAQWFDAGEGLRAVTALLEYLREAPGTVKRQAEVIDDLEDCRAELETAHAQGRPFHFCLVM